MPNPKAKVLSATHLLDPCAERLSAADTDELLPRFQTAMARYHLSPPLLYSIATLCLQYGYDDLWQYYDRLALSLPHLTSEDFYFRAQARLRRGEWIGWADRETRLGSPHEATIWLPHLRELQWTTRAWDGKESLKGMTLFAIADGGFGDCLQMLRYIPELARAAKSLIIAVKPQIASLVEYNFGHVATVVPIDRSMILPCDRYVWMMSLPALCGHIPAFEPLRAPSPYSFNRFHRNGPRVGICWAGNSRHPADRTDNLRSLSLDDLAPIFTLANVEWYSLQVGRWAADAESCPPIAPPPIPIRTFADSANVIGALDYIVTIDTSIAHLAGSLAAPTFLLLNWLPEFRWGLRDETTEWYPSIQLIRQSAPGDWSGVAARLAARIYSAAATGLNRFR
jgi:hypothetical protein